MASHDHRRGRAAGAACLTALLSAATLAAGAAAPAAGAVSPIQPGNQPTPIPNAVNGELPTTDLINVAPGCQADRDAASSLGLLLAEARDLDIPLGTDQCYRSVQGQVTQQQAWTTAGNSACAAPVVSSPTGQVAGTSMHGWGKAADFSDPSGSVGFGSTAYAFLKQYAGRVGWNHPGWAEPGGSPCPEAWHWEWVGDGGTMGATPVRADVVGLLPSGDTNGYASFSGLGALVARGDFVDRGSTASVPLSWLVVGASATAGSGGYWLVASDGGVFSFGDATFYGSTGGVHLAQPIVGMAPTPTGHGYWLVAADGGIFTFGDATFYGSWGGAPPATPVVSMLATPSGRGYWIASADGEVSAYGDAAALGPA